MSEERIVVGVDGSEASKAALRWAARQAAAFGASVDAVIIWQYPAGYGMGYAIPEIDEDFEQAADRTLNHAVAEMAGLYAGVEIRTHVAHGQPAEVLMSAAKGADLLVVGSRGHGGFTGLLLGSVSTQCVHHAPCPVVVVRKTS